MDKIIDLERYPLHRQGSAEWHELVKRSQAELARDGMFNLEGFLKPSALETAVAELKPLLAEHAYRHAREHNIYFKNDIDGLSPEHPALRRFETSNNTICADQMGAAVVINLYEWEPFATFLSAAMERPRLYPMADPLARVNVMSYGEGQALNWHFDRSEFTTTLLLQAPDAGGDFEYATDLRSDDDPNYDGVAALLEGRQAAQLLKLSAGTLNVFKGKNTAHRVTPVSEANDRIIAVFSYYEREGVMFSEAERIGFYGRAEAVRP